MSFSMRSSSSAFRILPAKNAGLERDLAVPGQPVLEVARPVVSDSWRHSDSKALAVR
jgi:hypothetical protein